MQREFWRVVPPEWAIAPLSGDAAAEHGGRYNRPGQKAYYLAMDEITAILEFRQDEPFRTGTHYAVMVNSPGIVDLRRPENLRALDITPDDLMVRWEYVADILGDDPVTWKIADILIRLKYNGALYPSSQNKNGGNLVLWRWTEHTVRLLDDVARFPRNRRSWDED